MPYNEAQTYNENPLPKYSMGLQMAVGEGFVSLSISVPDYAITGPGVPVGTTATEEQMDTAMQTLLDLLVGATAVAVVYDVQKSWSVEWHQEGSATP